MTKSSADFGKWLEDGLAANPRLTRAGLARHLGHGNDRSRVTKMISGDRRIRVDEIAEIAAYLGVPPPSLSDDVADVQPLRIEGQIGAAWFEAGQAPISTEQVAPVLALPRLGQMAFKIDVDGTDLRLPQGAVAICRPPERGGRIPSGSYVVCRRSRADLENLTLWKSNGEDPPGRVVGIVVEIRVRV